jgi:hypothetical protein
MRKSKFSETQIVGILKDAERAVNNSDVCFPGDPTIRIQNTLRHRSASSNPATRSRPYRRARRSLSASSRSDHGG